MNVGCDNGDCDAPWSNTAVSKCGKQCKETTKGSGMAIVPATHILEALQGVRWPDACGLVNGRRLGLGEMIEQKRLLMEYKRSKYPYLRQLELGRRL